MLPDFALTLLCQRLSTQHHRVTCCSEAVSICNGDIKYLEPAKSGWTTTNALILSKNPYGLEIEMNYDVWFNAGYGEDRRRIETEVASVDDSYKWLCQAAHQGSSVQQAMLMKYRVTSEDPTNEDSNDMSVSGTSVGHHDGVNILHLVPWLVICLALI